MVREPPDNVSVSPAASMASARVLKVNLFMIFLNLKVSGRDPMTRVLEIARVVCIEGAKALTAARIARKVTTNLENIKAMKNFKAETGQK